MFCYMYRNLNVVKINKTLYGMGDMIFIIISCFEFVKLLSLVPTLID